MKHHIKNLTPPPLKSFLVRLGRFYSRNGGTSISELSFPSQEASLHTLKSLGWSPERCIDVGAYHGNWAKMLLAIYPQVKILMVEGQKEKEGQLLDAITASPDQLTYEIALLGASDGTEVDFVEMETGSSVLEESSFYSRTKKKQRLAKLDSILTKHSDFKSAQMLKLDTQGYEIEVMKGAERLLERVEVVLLEASLLPINKGAPAFSDIVGFMAERHFKLFDFCSQIRRQDGVLWQTDLLFIRDGIIPNLKAELTRENWG